MTTMLRHARFQPATFRRSAHAAEVRDREAAGLTGGRPVQWRMILVLIGQFCSGCVLAGGFEDPRNLAAAVEKTSEQICREYAASSFDELAARWFPSPEREEVLLQFRNFASELAPGTRPENLQLCSVRARTAGWFARARGASMLAFRNMEMHLHLSWVLKGDRWCIDGVDWVTHEEGARLMGPDNW